MPLCARVDRLRFGTTPPAALFDADDNGLVLATVWGAGVFVWLYVYKANTQTNTLLPARGRDLALRLALRKGVPASPLRSNPGTPFLDPPHHRCFGGARRRAWRGRAGSRVEVENNETEG